RDGVLAALRARRTYATNGARIFLDVSLAGKPMGSTIVSSDVVQTLKMRVIGTAEIAEIDVIRTGKVERAAGDGPDLTVAYPLPKLKAGEYVYVRVIQKDGGLAWSSPFFIE